MTDNEIVKALECMLGKYSVGEQIDCKGCAFETQALCSENASDGITKAALFLINRQKAEIERLQKAVEDKGGLILIETAKAEAYREFAEKSEKELFVKQNEHREHWMETLNRHRGTEAYKDHEWSIDNWLRGYGEAVQDILAINQNFLKELVGDDDA